MIYVPVIPPQPPSPRTLELAGLLSRVIQEYERHHPEVTGAEVRKAVHLAAGAARTDAAGVARVLAVVGLGVAVAVGAFVWLATSGGTGSGGSVPMVAVAVGVLLVAFFLAVVLRARSP